MRKFITTAIILLILTFSLLYFQLPINIVRPVFHTEIIEQCAHRYNLDPLLVTALIKVESNFFSRAKSNRGAVGLMQLMPSTARELAAELGYKEFKPADIENPAVNVALGTYYLHKLGEEFRGNQILMLASYNAGNGKVQLWHQQNPLISVEIDDIPYKETRSYVKDVTWTYQWLKKIQKLKNFLRGKIPR